MRQIAPVMNPKIMVLNGPNLNLLGVRQPHIYGYETLADIEKRLHARSRSFGLAIDMRQSNHEGELVAILDALLACEFPVIELHLSNPHKREEFRHRSFVTLAAKGVIAGFGAHGYELALDAMAQLIERPRIPAKRAKSANGAKAKGVAKK